ncbi:DUF6705 family protein [Pedobacter puniceum]|jgi:hypothetical protein|uniref:DUF6705 domain-containing protein n=1 Tax=Pedobacter puniceum TaxID=2666136 RepID=A0A7K0FMT4_9SPHI|nr:DUF6705 family protein [Pedobacter puniceum]MRX47276.1 hypothetical protein [Pedobacter puniceum]
MKRIYLSILIILISLTVQAQVIISLEQAEAYLGTPDGIPEDVTYVKDVNNILPKFVGIWKGTADGKIIELHLNKFLHLPSSADGFKIDLLAGRLLIKDQVTGAILYNTLNISDDEETWLEGSYPINGSYVMHFENKNDTYCMDGGEVYISVNNTTLTNMTFNFYRTQDIYVEGKCPNFETYVPILPKRIQLVKQ